MACRVEKTGGLGPATEDVEPMEIDDVYTSSQIDDVRPCPSQPDGEALTAVHLHDAVIPAHWTSMLPNSRAETVLVPHDTNEFVLVAAHFMKTMNTNFPVTKIVRIFRIQNPFLWRHYCLKHQEMVYENNGKAVVEKQLFHGTKYSTIDAICHQGFDWRVCGRHGIKYGQGCYFARDSRYSHMYSPQWRDPQEQCYILETALGGNIASFSPKLISCDSESKKLMMTTDRIHGHSAAAAPMPTVSIWSPSASSGSFTLHLHISSAAHGKQKSGSSLDMARSLPTVNRPWPNGLRYMLVARVLVGQWVQGHADYRRPPSVLPGKMFSKCFDSCVDCVQDPGIFVVFDSNQAYPEYVIEYS